MLNERPNSSHYVLKLSNLCVSNLYQMNVPILATVGDFKFGVENTNTGWNTELEFNLVLGLTSKNMTYFR